MRQWRVNPLDLYINTRIWSGSNSGWGAYLGDSLRWKGGLGLRRQTPSKTLSLVLNVQQVIGLHCCQSVIVFHHFVFGFTMFWTGDEEEEEDLMFSPALMARRASESWINTPPIEVCGPATLLVTSRYISPLCRVGVYI